MLGRYGKHFRAIISERSGIPKNQVGRIERGEVNTTISTLFVLAKALKIEPKQLLDF